MAQLVIYLLEVIQVDISERDRSFMTGGQYEELFRLFGKSPHIQ